MQARLPNATCKAAMDAFWPAQRGSAPAPAKSVPLLLIGRPRMNQSDNIISETAHQGKPCLKQRVSRIDSRRNSAVFRRSDLETPMAMRASGEITGSQRRALDDRVSVAGSASI